MAPFSFSSAFSLSIRLSIYRPAALSFITLSLHIPPPCSLYHLQPSSMCFSGRLLPWLDFASYYLCFLYDGRALFFFFLILSLLVWTAAETIEGKRRPTS